MKRIYNLQTVLPHVLIGLLLIFVAYMGSAQIPESIVTSANDIGKSYTAGTRIITGLPKYFPDTVKNETLFAMDKNNNRLFTWNPKSSRWEVDKIRGNSSSTPRMEVLNSLVFDYTNTILQDSNNFKYYRWDLTANIWNTGLNGSDTIPHTVVTQNYADNTYKYVLLPTVNALMTYAGTAKTVTITDTLRGGIFNLTTLTGNVVDSGVVFPSAISGYVWKRDVSNTDGIYVNWYGAKTATNAAIYINKVINNCRTYGKNNVRLSAGTYTASSPVYMKSGINLFGQGVTYTTIQMTADSNAIMFDTLAYCTNLTIKDIFIAGTNAGNMSLKGNVSAINTHTAQTGYYFENSSVTIENIYAVNFKGDGLHLDNIFTVTIRRCNANNNSGHGFWSQGGNTTLFEECYAQNIAPKMAGYRILGGAQLNSCNGINGGDFWGIFGGEPSYDKSATNYASINMTHCNIEAFAKVGIVFVNNPFGSSIQNCSFIPLNTATYDVSCASRPDSTVMGSIGFGGLLFYGNNIYSSTTTGYLFQGADAPDYKDFRYGSPAINYVYQENIGVLFTINNSGKTAYNTYAVYGQTFNALNTSYLTIPTNAGINKFLQSDAVGNASWQNINFWSLLGNTGTTAGTNFLGTTDATDLVFKTNNTEKLRILSNGNIGINNTAAAYLLDVNATANPLRLQGLQTGASTDSIVTSASGVLKRQTAAQVVQNGITKTSVTSTFTVPASGEYLIPFTLTGTTQASIVAATYTATDVTGCSFSIPFLAGDGTGTVKVTNRTASAVTFTSLKVNFAVLSY